MDGIWDRLIKAGSVSRWVAREMERNCSDTQSSPIYEPESVAGDGKGCPCSVDESIDPNIVHCELYRDPLANG